MREFRVTLTHHAGELARLTQLLANQGIDLRSVAAIADGQKAIACLVVEDVTATRAALADARITFVEDELISELVEDDPGSVAELAGRLAAAGVNIHSLYVLARDSPLIEIGMTVDNPKKAKRALEQ